MIGKIVGGFFLVIALAAGIGMYYLQVYAFYDEVPANGTDDVQLTLLATDEPESILYDSFKAINATSSPIRYRACFTTTQSQALLSETYKIYEKPVPLVAPSWFDCFDAQEIGSALEQGDAVAYFGQENVIYGIDRVVAVMNDGRGFVWHQINHCGEKAFDGEPLPEGCPPKPEN